MSSDSLNGEEETEGMPSSDFVRHIEQAAAWDQIFLILNNVLVAFGIICILMGGIMVGAVLVFGGQITNCLLTLKKESGLRMIQQFNQSKSEV